MEERRAAGEDLSAAELAAEVGRHVVDELSEDERELDGGQAALLSELNRERDEKETHQLMRAVATGKLALMRNAARRGGAGASFARDVAGVDGEDDEALADEDEEARLAAEEEARMGDGDDVLPEDDEDIASGVNDDDGEDGDADDDAFDFEAKMAARLADEVERSRGGAFSARDGDPMRQFRRSAADPATLAVQLLGDDEDSEAFLAKLHAKPTLDAWKRRPSRAVALVQGGRPSASAAPPTTAHGGTGVGTAGPLGLQHLHQQSHIAAMPSRAAAPSTLLPEQSSTQNRNRVKPSSSAPATSKDTNAFFGRSQSSHSAMPSVPHGHPPEPAPTAAAGLPTTGVECVAALHAIPDSHASVAGTGSREPLAPVQGIAFSSLANGSGAGRAGGTSSRPGNLSVEKSGATGFLAATATGGLLCRTDSSLDTSLKGATFAGSKSILTRPAAVGSATAGLTRAGATAGGLVSVATGKAVVFSDEASRSRAPHAVSGDQGLSRSASGFGLGSGSRSAAAPVSCVRAASSFAGTPSLFSVLKRTASGAK